MYQTIDAADHTSFLSNLLSFAETVGWTVVRNTSSEKILQIPSGGYVGLIVSGVNVEFQMFRVYDSTRAIADQLGVIATSSSSLLPRLTLHNQAFKVWLTVSDRRICGVCRISNTYHSFYLGYLLPFAPTDVYQFPGFVGANGDGTTWSTTTDGVQSFVFGRTSGRPSRVCLPTASWQSVKMGSVGNYAIDFAYVWPFDNDISSLGKTIAGDHVLYPAFVVSSKLSAEATADDGIWLGYLDGIYAISNDGTTSETVVTVDGVNYLVIPNVFRASENFALRLS
ncbi:hypothetical protein [Pseudomonas asplenii]|uniref:hypothetical protein n=1 Tax=Pseudomonas asplenii TaxID=53407 RepID=UPI000365BF3A|nr:hypothetical protein [Pseudomonas fuscovaginae]